MADTQEIYRLFSATPLRLRRKAARSPTASPSADSDGPRTDAPRAIFATPSRANNHSEPLSPSAFVTPMKPKRSPVEVERLEARIESACRVRDDVEPVGSVFQTPRTPKTAAVVAPPQPQPQRRQSTRTAPSKPAVAPSTTEPPQAMTEVAARKQKRTTRSVAVLNSNTGGVYVDTPTKATAPPKRSRKSAIQPSPRRDPQPHQQAALDHGDDFSLVEPEQVGKKNITTEPLSISRNMMDAFADIDEAVLGPVAMELPKSARKKTALRRNKTNNSRAYISESGMKTFAFETSDEIVHSIMKSATKERTTTDSVSITRNIMNDFADIDEVLPEPTLLEKPKSTKTKSVSRRQTVPRQTKSKKVPGRTDEPMKRNLTFNAVDNEEADKENIDMAPVSISRNILDEFTDSDEVQPEPPASKKPTSKSKKGTSRRQTVPRRTKTMKVPPSADDAARESFGVEITHATQSNTHVDKENITAETVSISRNIMDDYAEIEEAPPGPVVMEKPTKPMRKAASGQSRKKNVLASSVDTVMENLVIETSDVIVQSDANKVDQENAVMEVDYISRNVGGDSADIDEAKPDPDAFEKPKTMKKKAAPRRQTAPRQTKHKKASEGTVASVVVNPVYETADDVVLINLKEDDGKCFTTETASISRVIMEDFDDTDKAQPAPLVIEKGKSRKKKAAPRPQAASRLTKSKKSPIVKPVTAVQEPIRRSRRLHNKVEPVIPVEVLIAVEETKPTEGSTVVDEAEVADDDSTIITADTVAESINVVNEPMTVEMTAPVEVASPSVPVIDVVEVFCKPLLETKTTSGALFALWFNALAHEVGVCTSEEADTVVEILRDFFGACVGIGRTEAIARARVDGEDDSGSVDTMMGELSKKTKRKAVRFRHFDLSSLNLRYNEDRSVAGFVDGLIREYVGVVDHITRLWDRRHNPFQANMVAHIIAVLSDTDRLAERTKGDSLVSSTFRSMSEFEHDEVRASQPFFSDEFAKLASEGSTQPPFMEVVYSSLIQSLVRFRLRELFLPYDPKALLDDGDRLQIATYEHQDFGAAVHRALKEIYLYDGLATPILTVLQNHPDPRDAAVKCAIQALDIDDLVHVERFMLACRYLRLSFGTCVLLDRDEDEETAQLCEGLEQLCTLVKRLMFEDETHLFPLASIEDFVRVLKRREPLFVVLEKVLETVGLPHYDAEAPCVECNEIVTRAQQAEAISCCSCSGRFHLGCLGLPLSFAQFAGNYTCPFCYLGRTR